MAHTQNIFTSQETDDLHSFRRKRNKLIHEGDNQFQNEGQFLQKIDQLIKTKLHLSLLTDLPN